LRQPVADDLFGRAVALGHVGRLRAAIDVGGVEEVDARVQRLVHDREARRPVRQLAKVHGAEGDAADAKAGAAEMRVIHFSSPHCRYSFRARQFPAGFSRCSPSRISASATTARTMLPMKVASIEMPSSRKPPTTAPSRIEAWIAATIRLPPASGASSAFCDIHVIQITENIVFIAPQIAMNRAAIVEELNSNNPTVAPPITNAGSFRNGAALPLMKRPAAHVPTKPAQPRISSRIESVVTSTPV